MRGSIKQRYEGSWSLILDLGYQPDPVTGKPKRKQKWITFRGSKRDAQTRLNELLTDQNKGTFVEPSKRTVGEWLDEWLGKAIKPPRKTQHTYENYKGAIEKHLKPALGTIRLQQLKPTDLERFYADTKLAPATLGRFHAIMHGALEAAVRGGLVQRNVAKLVTGKPRAMPGHADVLESCWSQDEAKKFLDAAKEAGEQPAAFYSLALESGMRKAELCGLKWIDVDLAKGVVTVQRQLTEIWPPEFGPVKNKVPRTIDITPDTVALLKRHKAHQAEIKLKSGGRYADYGLVFAKEWRDMHRERFTLGAPIQMNNLGEREFAKLIAAAKVRRIKFHGLRHTCATLMLSAGVAAHVVQKRLGHAQVTMTLQIYAHALPAMQQDAAARLGALPHG